MHFNLPFKPKKQQNFAIPCPSAPYDVSESGSVDKKSEFSHELLDACHPSPHRIVSLADVVRKIIKFERHFRFPYSPVGSITFGRQSIQSLLPRTVTLARYAPVKVLNRFASGSVLPVISEPPEKERKAPRHVA